MKHYTGSCLCGQVTYTVDDDLSHIIACHCTQCRKSSGHFVASTRASDTKNISISGEVTWFVSSNQARRGFCGVCGSNLFWQPGDHSTTSIFAGTLDGDTGLKITEQIHVESKGDYYELQDIPIITQHPIRGTTK